MERAQVTAAPDARRRELAQIHIAKAQLGLDDETYRAMLWTVGRVKSSADLDYAGRKAVLDHLKARGFTAALPKRANEWAFIDRAEAGRRPLLRKICAVCRAAGRGKTYAEGLALRMFGVERLEFAAPDQLHKIASALVYDQARRQAKAAS